MSELEVKKIPYAITDYDLIRRGNYYYVDKTRYIAIIEDAGRYLFLIRPRRFGKSLFLAVLHGYYDVYYKESFDQLFKDTWIHTHPTPERGSYLVLPFNFSAVDPAHDKIDTSFLNHIKGRAHSFVKNYSDYLGKDKDYFLGEIEESRSGSDILSIIVQLCKDAQRKLYIIIDEYDNFANTILTTSGKDAYEDLTHGEGFFRSFFNILKTGTTGIESSITRLFITGVSPVTLDDVTSGFNIGDNISLDPAVNSMIGFTGAEVREIIDYYHSAGYLKHEPGYLVEILTKWYGNYIFSQHSLPGQQLFNSDMILYFLKEYFKIQTIPDDLIDWNVRIDYKKLRHLIILDKGETITANGNFSRLKQIIEEEEIAANLVKGFPVEKLTHTENFLSLLFYFGLLTIKEKTVENQELVLKIPNETIRRLFYDYIKEGYEETGVFSLDLYTYNRLMHGMAVKGEWEPLLKYICGRIRESMSLRDLITGEKSIQAFLNVYLGLSSLFIIHAEKELNKGYADIVMEPFVAVYEGLKYSYVLEIKYIKPEGKRKKKPAPGIMEKLKIEAAEQLRNYSIDEKFRKSMEKTRVIKLALIFYGSDLVYMGEH
jgi:hypothetical protein